ncbi:Hypothetical protein BQ3484_562 [Cedratvirus A11]|uniref:Uncharacterized protein n=1 Tax=Cedratvirus A11 TaxID=1903266 RepID=A0A1M7XVM9_9VIRU|nr:Hypothetical protein BQ3484_562 [Cedratvirus A11]SHO33630.1 Hypothetical protein BQ3484_562 [Cedratvirus A11]
MSLWVCRLGEFEKSPLPSLLDKNILSREYILEDIYKFTYEGELEQEALNIIDSLRLFNLWFFSSFTQLDMYNLKPLLSSMIKNFFGFEVDSFLIYNLNFTGLRLIPLDVNGNFVYSSWSKINYFIYHVQVDNLLSYQIGSYRTGESPAYRTEEKSYSLFGTDFVPKRIETVPSDFAPPLKREDLPHPQVLDEIRESFQTLLSENISKGPFWTSLDRYWLEEAWLRILLQQLPLITVYYSRDVPDYELAAQDENLSLKLELLAHLAGAREVSSQTNSVSFVVSSREEIENILTRMQAEEPQMAQWLVLGTDNPEQTLLLQVAFENKYPNAVAWSKDGKIVVNLTQYVTPEFSDEELFSTPDTLPKQFQTRRQVINIPPLLERNGQTEVKIGPNFYPLEFSYSELSPLWSDSILTPWAIERYKQGRWTEQWFR